MSESVVAVRSIEIVTAEIYTIRDNVARVFMDGVIQIGRRLEEAKQLVPQGEWLNYLDTKLGYKPSTAQNYICSRSRARFKTENSVYNKRIYEKRRSADP